MAPAPFEQSGYARVDDAVEHSKPRLSSDHYPSLRESSKLIRCRLLAHLKLVGQRSDAELIRAHERMKQAEPGWV